MPERIVYVDQLPIVTLDAEGVGIVCSSGTFTWRRRCSRALWRRHLETQIRALNEFETAERASGGNVVQLGARRAH